MKVTKNPSIDSSIDTSKASTITAAEDTILDELSDDPGALGNAIDDIADTVDDISSQIEDVQEDDTDIELDNNISGHYIAECTNCHNVFISAVIESDQDIDHISGICPVCDKDTDQLLKWVIKDK